MDNEDDEMPGLVEASDSEDDGEGDDDGDDDMEADVEAAYQHTKSLGDADREVRTRAHFILLDADLNSPQAMKSRPKANLTRDIQPLFKEEHIMDSSGVVVKGHWCLLCKYVSILYPTAVFLTQLQEGRCPSKQMLSFGQCVVAPHPY
jgi:hypothetical protein